MAPSPNSLTMYEQDQGGLHTSSISSCGGDDPLSPQLDTIDATFDLKPQFECNDDSLLKIDLASLNSSLGDMSSVDSTWSAVPEPGVLKMEDVFQEEKSPAIIQGPTLAALNFESFETTSSTGFMEDIESGLVGAGQAVTSQPNGLQTLQQQQQQNAILQARSLAPPTPEEKKSVNKQKWNTTSLLSAFLTRPSLHSFSSGSGSGSSKATCTVSSPTACDEKIFSENNPSDGRVECKLSRGGAEQFKVAGSFSLVPEVTTTVASQKVIIPKGAVAVNNGAVQNTNLPLMVVSNDLIETKSALADLLTQPTTQLCPLVPVSVKTELFPAGSSCQVQPILTPLTPVQTVAKPGAKPGAKRSNSPNNDSSSNSSGGSMDRKWEEIKQFIYNDEMPNFPTGSKKAAMTGNKSAAITGSQVCATGSQNTGEPLIKKVKTEPEGNLEFLIHILLLLKLLSRHWTLN